MVPSQGRRLFPLSLRAISSQPFADVYVVKLKIHKLAYSHSTCAELHQCLQRVEPTLVELISEQIVEDLYFGKIKPYEKWRAASSELQRLAKRMTDCESQLTEQFNEE